MSKHLKKIMKALKPLTAVKSGSLGLGIQEDKKDGSITTFLTVDTCPEPGYNTHFSVANGEQLRIFGNTLHLNPSCLKLKLLPNILAYYIATNMCLSAEAEYNPALKQEYKDGPTGYASVIEFTNQLFEHATKDLSAQQCSLVRLVTISSQALRCIRYNYSRVGIGIKGTEPNFYVETALDMDFDYQLTIKPEEKGYLFTIGQGDSAVSKELIKYKSLKGMRWDRRAGRHAMETGFEEMMSEYCATAKEATIEKRLLKMEKNLKKQSKELKELMSALDIY